MTSFFSHVFFGFLLSMSFYLSAMEEEIEHKRTGFYTHLTADEIYKIKNLVYMKTTTKGMNDVEYPSFIEANRLVVYNFEPCLGMSSGAKCDQKNKRIFVINKQVYDNGNETVIRLAEELFFLDEKLISAEVVAVKILSKNKANKTLHLDFKNEENIMSGLERLRYAYEDDDFKYLFNDFIEGDNLDTLIQQGNLDDNTKDKIAIACVTAVHNFHQQGFLHNDIKPSNIIVKNTKDYWKVFLVDFGHSCAGTNAKNCNTGTAGYRDPDRSGFEGNISVRARCPTSNFSDYYQLGIVIFELLAKKKHNFKQYLRLKKERNKTFEYDLEYADLPEAFPDSYQKNYVIDKSSLRYQLISLAKKFTKITRFRPSADEVEQWLIEHGVSIKKADIQYTSLPICLHRKTMPEISFSDSSKENSPERANKDKTLKRMRKQKSGDSKTNKSNQFASSAPESVSAAKLSDLIIPSSKSMPNMPIKPSSPRKKPEATTTPEKKSMRPKSESSGFYTK